MKKIINAPNAVVSEMLQGIEKANPKIIYYPGAEVIARKEKINWRALLRCDKYYFYPLTKHHVTRVHKSIHSIHTLSHAQI